MANRRELVKRRNAVRNIRKITRTMQLIATARFQQAVKRLHESAPFTDKLAQLVRHLAAASEGLEHPLMRDADETLPADLLVITSNRGLCGAYNANILRTGGERIVSFKEQGLPYNIRLFGKKGVGYMQFAGHEMTESITDLGDIPRFEEIEPYASALMERFLHGEIGSAHVVYMKFVSAGKQVPVVEQILPLSREATAEEQIGEPEAEHEYEFSPEPKALLDELFPMTVRVGLFRCFNDAVVSEQAARMVAMKGATDSAEEMIKILTQQYNRARQTAITMELLDIVGGANALA